MRGAVFAFSINILFLFHPVTFASEIPTPFQTFKKLALAEKLSFSKEWLSLGHYQGNILSGYTSQADDLTFFISPNGKNAPKKELLASINSLSAEHPEFSCQFPARRHWLLSQMKKRGLINEVSPTPPGCLQFHEWLETINTKTVTLVFASSYLNSPSSMFGHTFLRLDQPDQSSDNLLLANTISYAANGGDNENEFMFAYRGIFGGYPGVTTIEPYYDKIKLYSHLENRDLWEYQLNLNKEETAQLLRATWEVKDKRFDYYFFDENCSYRILALIDIARPGTNLLDEISYRAIPSDTVRLVVKKDLIEHINFRASSSTALNHKLNQLSEQKKKLILQLLEQRQATQIEKALNGYTPVEQVNILDTAFDYLRFQAIDQKQSHQDSANFSHQLLLTRSQLQVKSNLQPAPTPMTRDDQGHETLRLSIAAGQLEQENFVQLGIRPAYHDLSDPIDGYQPGAQLQFLRSDFRYYPELSNFQIEQIVAIEIMSLTPRDQFFKPTSWQVGFGARRVFTTEDRVLTPYLEGGTGLSYRFLGGISYALLTADLEMSSKISKGYNIGPGAELAWAFQGKYWQSQVGAKSVQFLDAGHHQRNSLFIEQSFTVNKNWSFKFDFKRELDNKKYNSQWGLATRYYY